MKVAVLMALLAAVCFIMVPIFGQERSTKPNADEQSAENIATQTSASVGHDAAQAEGNKAEKGSPRYFSRLFSPENLPNVGLFIAGLAGIFIAISTLKSIKKQAELMEGQLIAMQRPRIEVKHVFLIPSTTVRQGIATIQNHEWQIGCVIANTGGSKARITESNLTIKRLGVGSFDGLLPPMPLYEGQHLFGQFVIESGERQEKSVLLDDPAETRYLYALHEDAEAGRVTATSPVACFGFIYYRDDSGVGRRTGFLTQWNPSDCTFTGRENSSYAYTD
jgi:hypothetical protein